MKTIEVVILGMNCGACLSHVTGALQSVPGVRDVQVDLATGRATIQHDNVSREQLAAAVNDAGYKVQETETE